jgi:hypothetical protein
MRAARVVRLTFAYTLQRQKLVKLTIIQLHQNKQTFCGDGSNVGKSITKGSEMTGLQRMVPIKKAIHKECELSFRQEQSLDLLDKLAAQAKELFEEGVKKEFLLDSHIIRISGIEMDWAIFVDNKKAFSIVMGEIEEINLALVEILK